MSKNNLHIIQRQRVELQTPRRLHGPALQQQFQRLLEEQLLPRLEPVFDRLAGPDVWIELDQLDIHLGRLSTDVGQEAWLERAFEAFVAELEEQIRRTPAVSREEREREVLLFYLEHGYLPWWVEKFSISEAAGAFLSGRSRVLLARLRKPLLRRRWVRQAPEDVQQGLLAALGEQPPIERKTWAACAVELSPLRVRETYWESLWETLAGGGELEQDWPEKLVRSTMTNESGRDRLRRSIRSSPALPVGMKSRLLKAIDLDEVDERTNEGNDKDNRNGTKIKKTKALEEGIYIPLAGIVVAHAFLPAFFERLGLLADGQFENEEARERAVHILYFLATGQQHPEESETALLKLLCGLELETPIARKLDLSEAERTEAEHLLASIIRQWGEAIEGTTPEELRGSFLVREGKLRYGAMGWQLTVEAQAWDVLLSKLSWGLSPILHSWMREMVWVEWG